MIAAIAVTPTGLVDWVLRERIWERDREDETAGYLQERAEGLWDGPRALVAARNRLAVRAKLGV